MQTITALRLTKQIELAQKLKSINNLKTNLDPVWSSPDEETQHYLDLIIQNAEEILKSERPNLKTN